MVGKRGKEYDYSLGASWRGPLLLLLLYREVSERNKGKYGVSTTSEWVVKL